MGWTAKDWLLALLPPTAVACLYAQTLGFGFVWDDVVLANLPVYAHADVRAVLTSAANGFEYLPVRDLSLILDHRLFGSWHGGFHLVNTLLFALSGGLLYAFYGLLFGRAREARVRDASRPLALLCALTFAIHPLLVESAVFVMARNSLLALVFSLGAMLAFAVFVLRGSRAGYAISLLLTAAALFSKATVLSLVLMLGLLQLHLEPRAGLRQVVRATWPFLLVTGVAFLGHVLVGQATGVLQLGQIPGRIPRAAFIAAFYVYKCLWPVDLTVEYDLAWHREHWVLPGMAVVILAAGAASIVIRGWRLRSLPCVLVIGYALAMLPVSKLLPSYPSIADRYAIMPMMYLVPLLLAPPIAWLHARAGSRGPVWLTAVGVALVALLAPLSWRQIQVWRDDEALFRHTVAINPLAKEALGNLGSSLLDRGRDAESLAVYAQLEEVDPTDYRPAYTRGLLAARAGRLDEARRWFESAVEKRGASRYEAHVALAELHLLRGDRPAAIERFEIAREILERAPPTARARRLHVEQRLRLLGASPE